MANASIGALFLAGLLPSLLMAALMMLTKAYYTHKNSWGADNKFEKQRVVKALLETALVMLGLYQYDSWRARQGFRRNPPLQSPWHCCSQQNVIFVFRRFCP